jgi:long-chain fatty acid transport protein
MSHRSRLTFTALTLIAAAAFAPQAHASGFQLREQSPSGQGNAFAGVSAGGNDISSMFFNPAVMTQFSGNQFAIGGSYIGLSAEYSGGTASRTPALVAMGFNASYLPISGQPTHGNAAISAVLPEINLMYSMSKDLKLGISVNVPFGLTTEYDGAWVGRYHALKSDLKTIDIAPSIAYRFSPEWSGGVAFVARKADAELSNGVDYGTALAMSAAQTFHDVYGFSWAAAANAAISGGAIPGGYDGKAGLKGNGWGYGFKAGLIWEPTRAFKIGLAHQSAMTMTLKGDAAFEIPASIPNVAPLFLANGLAAKGLKNGKGSAELNLPATTSLGFNYIVSDAFSFQGEAALSTWSRFKELRVKFDTGAPDSVTAENWKDTWYYSLGGTWKLNQAWTLRAGLAMDQGAVDDNHRTPRIPDNDRKWVSLGATYTHSRAVSLDFGYTRIFVGDGKVNLTSAGDNTLRGSLSGNIKAAINILGAQIRYSF